jgi:hypothetical protein
MAKKIYQGDQVVGFEPGVIYELRYGDTPFYVGETTDPDRRHAEHIYGGNSATVDSETKYQFINQLNSLGIEWTLKVVNQYGSEGPEALEDEHMMALLVDGYSLTNERKGNANWMAERLAVADDMRARGIRSYKQYKETVENELTGDRRTAEQIQKLADTMTNILGSAEESLQWAIKNEKRTARNRKKAQATPELKTVAEETFRLATQFPIAEQIELLQGLCRTYQDNHAGEEIFQMTVNRLAELQAIAK